jgi:hypothetical protein
MTKRVVSPTLSVRVSAELYASFKKKSTKYGGPSENRLTVTKPKTVKETLYALD